MSLRGPTKSWDSREAEDPQYAIYYALIRVNEATTTRVCGRNSALFRRRSERLSFGGWQEGDLGLTRLVADRDLGKQILSSMGLP